MKLLRMDNVSIIVKDLPRMIAFLEALGHRFPHLTEPELERLVRDRLERCHNRNY